MNALTYEQLVAFNSAIAPLDPILAAFATRYGYAPRKLAREYPHRRIDRQLTGAHHFIEIVLETDDCNIYPTLFSPDALFATTTGAGVGIADTIYRRIGPFDWLVLPFSELLQQLPTLLEEAERLLSTLDADLVVKTGSIHKTKYHIHGQIHGRSLSFPFLVIPTDHRAGAVAGAPAPAS